MKKVIVCIGIIILFFIVLPFIEIKKDNNLIYIKYSSDISFFEDYTCYHESVSYNKNKDISITGIDIKKYFIFYLFELEYKKGNLCDSEFLLEESYIEEFIEKAEIIYNSHNIDVKSLIENKEAIVSNTRYFGNDYENVITYKLDGKYNEMYIFYKDDLVILQVGSPDESIKFIAYK